MTKDVAKAVIALFFLSSLFVTSGQDRPITTQDRMVSAPTEQRAAVLVPQINRYGSLVGLKDTAGKDLLKETKHRWREGYAVAYQVKDWKGVYKDHFVYVMGNSTKRLKVEDRKSTTSRKVVTTGDQALELGRLFTWDEKSRALKSAITITNTSSQEVILKAIEINIDKSVAARLTLQGGARPPYDIVNPQCPPGPGIGTILASMDCEVGDACPSCGCGKLCTPKPGQARIFDRDPLNPVQFYLGDLIGPKLPRFKESMLCLSWAGSSLTRSVLKPGEQIVVHYRLIIP